jgi:hypothetical protein
MSLDARISTTLPSHPKTKKLIRRIGMDGAWKLICFFLWARQAKPDGDLAGMSDEDLELAVDWHGEPGALISAMSDVGFLDGEEFGRSLHDWEDHNPFAAGQSARSDKARLAGLVRQYGAEKGREMFHAYQARKLQDDSSELATSSDDSACSSASSSATSSIEQSDELAGSTPPSSKSPAPSPSPSPYPLPKPNTPPTPRKRGREPVAALGLEFLLSAGVPAQAAKDWLAVRAKSRAPLTESAWNGLVREAQRAGLSPAQAVQIAAEKGWRGFEASWIADRGARPGLPAPAAPRETVRDVSELGL